MEQILRFTNNLFQICLMFACTSQLCLRTEAQLIRTILISPNSNASSSTKIPAATGPTYGKLSLTFEPNQGQTDARVKFLTRGSGYTLFMTAEEAVFAGREGSVQRMKLPGSNRNARVEP